MQTKTGFRKLDYYFSKKTEITPCGKRGIPLKVTMNGKFYPANKKTLFSVVALTLCESLVLNDSYSLRSNGNLFDIVGMVWYGMVWHGMAWHGMAWHGMAWHGMAWHGMACYHCYCCCCCLNDRNYAKYHVIYMS